VYYHHVVDIGAFKISFLISLKFVFDFLVFEINNNKKLNSMSPRSMEIMDTGEPGNRG